MTEPAAAPGSSAALPPRDIEYAARFFGAFGWLLRRILRLDVTGLEHLDPSRPGVLVTNHNLGCWGLLDVAAVGYAFYHLQKPPALLAGMGEELAQKVPILGKRLPRAGMYVGTPANLRACLDRGDWLLIPPGGNCDMGRPIWMRNRVRFQKPFWVKGKRYFREQVWYLPESLARRVPLYPVAISGTHEMTPVLWESPRLFRYSGLKKLREKEFWGGYPITANHLVNLAIFLATPLRSSLFAWVVFALLNLYADPLFTYPLFPFPIRVRFGRPIEDVGYSEELPFQERQASVERAQERLVGSVNELLEQLDGGTWRRWFLRSGTDRTVTGNPPRADS